MSSEKILNNALHAALLTILLLIPYVNSAPSIPEDLGQVNQWFNSVVKPYTQRKGSLDPPLETAEAATKVIKVRKDGSGDFNTIAKAIASVPSGNTKRTIIWIGPGKYDEKITIDRDKPFITLYGSPNAVPTLSFNGTAAKYGTVDSATLIVMSDYFVAANLIIANSAPMPDGQIVGAQAVALRASGDKQAFYNCRILGYQDTLCDDRGNHFFKNCYIEGTVDFIFGSGKSIYLGTELHVLGTEGLRVITAQARELTSEDQGYSFVHCSITGDGKGAYLGRAWKSRPLVVFAYTNMGSVVDPTGWSDNFHPDRDSLVFYGEYKGKGEGSNLSKRVPYTKVLSDNAAQPFISLDFIKANTWLLPPPTL
ncbi:hypothetical protein SLEP1_g52585 [Rubroshorea leprosula]|uniref:Pectinesterase n=1 Tax=Rubroshorea leprosula TaxID=152421 RepID=A0AAV5M9E7_9ROSI|nr:hypothetical protein SLEP1_g52585 [Rubroshorea leprosula]